MSLVSNSIAQIKRLLFTFLGFIRRAFCCRRFLRKQSGEPILPVTIKTGVHSTYTPQNSSFSSGQTQFSQYSQVNTTWQSWNKQNSSFGNPQLTHDSPNVQSIGMNNPIQHSTPQQSGDQSQQQQEEEDDYFRDMMPKIKKQKKVLLKPQPGNSSHSQSNNSPDKFNFEPNFQPNFAFGSMIESSQIGGSWDEEETEIEDSLREARETERMKRKAEHQRTKTEKKSSRSKSNLTATRLS